MEELFKKLKQKYGAGAVILSDGHDAPVARHIGNSEIASGSRRVLRDFYSGFKNSIKDTRFAFVAGISGFAYTAMDSGSNYFYDLSFGPEYAGICGFTIPELDDSFRDRIAETLAIMADNGKMKQGAQVKDLRKKILSWNGGCN
ncbi:MAG: AAA family ATPase [Deltaproteobacteria bacterium]|nr:AAA family ATPase [Deltaproteobacteria bacterium]